MEPSKLSRKGKEKVDDTTKRPNKALRIHFRGSPVSPPVAQISLTTGQPILERSGYAFCETPSITRGTAETHPSHNIVSLHTNQSDHELNDEPVPNSQPIEGHVNDSSTNDAVDTHNDEGGESGKQTDPEVDSCNRIFLIPDGEKAFLPSYKGTKNITKVIKGRYNQFWESWGKIPEATRKMWFLREWKKYVDWDPVDDDHMWIAFNHIGARYLSDNFTRLRKSKRRPYWIAEPIWAQLLNYWASPTFMEISSRNKINCAINEASCRNTTGSISIREHKMKLSKELGRDCTIDELYRRCHMKKGDQQEELWVSAVAEQNYEKFMQLKTTQSSMSSTGMEGGATTTKTDRQLWVEAVGVSRKGRIHGLGSNTNAGDRALSSRQSRVTHGTVPSHVINELVQQRV